MNFIQKILEHKLDEAKDSLFERINEIAKQRLVSGNTVKRIPAMERIKKARLLKRSWKTTRKSKLRRTLMKRKMSMRRRKSMGLK